MREFSIAAIMLATVAAQADETTKAIDNCLSCHINMSGRIDIVGIRALEALPETWSLQFEDAYDLDGDGVAGRVQFVSGDGQPRIAKWGRHLAAARFKDFALIASRAHDVPIKDDKMLEAIQTAFEAASPAPTSPFKNDAEKTRFIASGCSACHVMRTFELDGKTYRPLSDFLLHDMGQAKPSRTKPLWGYQKDLWQTPHMAKTFPK